MKPYCAPPLVVLLSLLAVFCAPSRLQAQESAVFQGSLAQGDRTFEDGSWIDVWEVDLGNSEKCQAILSWAEFSPHLIVVEPGGTFAMEAFAEAGDGSELVLDYHGHRDGGPHRIIVAARNRGEGGDYELKIVTSARTLEGLKSPEGITPGKPALSGPAPARPGMIPGRPVPPVSTPSLPGKPGSQGRPLLPNGSQRPALPGPPNSQGRPLLPGGPQRPTFPGMVSGAPGERPAPPSGNGAAIENRLEEGDDTFGGYWSDQYTVTLQPGDVLTVQVDTDGFIPEILTGWKRQRLNGPRQRGTDEPPEQTARIEFRSSESGNYHVFVLPRDTLQAGVATTYRMLAVLNGRILRAPSNITAAGGEGSDPIGLSVGSSSDAGPGGDGSMANSPSGSNDDNSGGLTPNDFPFLPAGVTSHRLEKSDPQNSSGAHVDFFRIPPYLAIEEVEIEAYAQAHPDGTGFAPRLTLSIGTPEQIVKRGTFSDRRSGHMSANLAFRVSELTPPPRNEADPLLLTVSPSGDKGLGDYKLRLKGVAFMSSGEKATVGSGVPLYDDKNPPPPTASPAENSLPTPARVDPGALLAITSLECREVADRKENDWIRVQTDVFITGQSPGAGFTSENPFIPPGQQYGYYQGSDFPAKKGYSYHFSKGTRLAGTSWTGLASSEVANVGTTPPLRGGRPVIEVPKWDAGEVAYVTIGLHEVESLDLHGRAVWPQKVQEGWGPSKKIGLLEWDRDLWNEAFKISQHCRLRLGGDQDDPEGLFQLGCIIALGRKGDTLEAVCFGVEYIVLTGDGGSYLTNVKNSAGQFAAKLSERSIPPGQHATFTLLGEGENNRLRSKTRSEYVIDIRIDNRY